MNQEYKGKLAVLGAAVMWGIGTVVLKKFYEAGYSVPTMLFYSVSFTLLILLGFWKKIDFKPGKEEFKRFIVIMLLGNASGFMIFYAYKFTKIALVEFLHYTMPAWAFIIAVFFLKERIGKWRILALILSMVGVSLVFNIKTLFNGFDLANLGNILALLTAVTFAVQINVIRKTKSNTFTINFWDFLMSMAIVTPIYFLNNTITSISQIGLLFLNSAVLVVTPMLLYFYGTQKIEVTKSSIILLFEIIVAVIAAWIFLKEVLSVPNIIGGLLVLISSVILIIKKK